MSEESKSQCSSSDDSISDTMDVTVLRMLLENIRNNEESMKMLRNQLSKVSQRKISTKKRSDKCVHCDAIVELDKLKEFVTCKGCEELACHNQKCSDFVYGLDVWECARCKKNRVIQQRAGEWLLKQLNQVKDVKFPIHLEKDKVLSLDDDQSLAAFVSRDQRENVRQFIEELLAKLLDGPLDDVSVGQLSADDNCLPMIGAIPSNVTHQELKKFIQSVCEEFMNLPNTFDFSGVPGRHEEPLPVFDPKKYEQLLATAVLNKMTDFYQNDKNSQNNSSGIHSDLELDSNHNQLNGKAMIDLMVKRDEVGQFSSPTIERLNSKALDDETHLSDYVQNHYVPLPDLSASDSANDDADEHSMNSSNGTDATWEDNWLFKKRKLKTENQSIAMLVPSPTEEIKALIGDKNADETSDLSENSDTEDDDGLKKKSFTNTLLIAPKKEFATISITASPSDSLKSMQSLTSLDNSNPNIITEAKNNLLLTDTSTPEPIQKINFVLNAPVTFGAKPLGELNVTVDKPTEVEEEFDSIISPTQVREHKKSIDEEFEKLLMDDNNNTTNPLDVTASEVFKTPIKAVKKVEPVIEVKPIPAPAESAADATTKTDLYNSDDWVMVSCDDDDDLKATDESISVETNTSLKCNPASPTIHKSDTFDSQTELAELVRDGDEAVAESPKSKRYSSPLFLELMTMPHIEPVKISQPTIPEDDSINKLLHATNLVSKSQKSPQITKQEDEIFTPTNITNNNEPSEDEALDDLLLKTFSVQEKRPSFNDPEQVLMKNVVPGSHAEREHIKWLHAAPIANNPYSTEVLQRRLSESEHKQKGFGIPSNHKLVDALIEESNVSEAEKEQNEEVFQAQKVDMKKYKRDYYINDSSSDAQKRYSYASSTSKSPSCDAEDDHSDNIVPVTNGGRVFRPLSLQTGDIDSAGGSIASDQDIPETQGNFLSLKFAKSNDNSLTYSEDSDTTRIYNLNTRVTKIVAPVEDVKVESPIESPVKLGQKFFDNSNSSRNVPVIRKMDDEVTTVIRTSNRNLMNGDDVSGHVVQENYEEKQVIEPEVIDNLPSVKKLAEIYTKDGSTHEVQLSKPKAFIATAEDSLTAPVFQHVKVTKTCSDSFAPNYNNTYHPAMPIASITARSIPSQIRADLKKSLSYDEESLIRHSDREGSPEIQAGVTRNSIAFFENLRQN